MLDNMHKISLSSLYCFAVCAECNSFTQAAARLFVTQGAVSKQIKQLEIYLGVQLFHRNIPKNTPHDESFIQSTGGHYIVLTEAGILLHQHVKAGLGTISQGINRVTKSEISYLRIAAAPTFATRWLSTHLHDFHYQYSFIETTVLDGPSMKPIDCEIVYSHSKPTGDAYLLMLEKNSATCAAHLFEPDIEHLFMGRQLLHILSKGEQKLTLWQDWLDQAEIAKMNLQLNAKKGLSFSTQDQVINATLNGLGIAILDQNMISDLLKMRWLFPITHHTLDGPFGYWLCIKNTSENHLAMNLFKNWILQKSHGI